MRSNTPPGPARAARVLIVDDSAVMRALLRSVVGCDTRLEVAGAASDGASALRTLDSLRPDLILLDVEMPGMDGVSTLKQLKARGSRIPVIMCSSLTHRGAKVTIEALASGAADYVAKPAGQPSRDAAVQALAHDLVPKILALTASATGGQQASAPNAAFSPAPWAASRAPVEAKGLLPGQYALPPGVAVMQPGSGAPTAALVPPAVVLVGVSTGGPAALDVVLPSMPGNFPLPILIVQHMPELFTKMLAERLNTRCAMRVQEAVEREPVRGGTIYIARGDWHMKVASGGPPALRLTQEAPENHCRPAADVLFRTGVAAYGARTLGVVLTGMGYDGLAGSRLIRDAGGTVLAQDQATSAVWGMPGAVAQAGLAHRVLPLNEIAIEILRLTRRSQREAPALRESAV